MQYCKILLNFTPPERKNRQEGTKLALLWQYIIGGIWENPPALAICV